jgi:hypothetical protein
VFPGEEGHCETGEHWDGKTLEANKVIPFCKAEIGDALDETVKEVDEVQIQSQFAEFPFRN